MLPISLTIKGINSYQKETVFKFDQLSAAGLFGVFGKVGSGKSTIIDAITLALFDKTEKLGGKDKRNYNLMNLQSKELLIDFEFCAGKELNDKYKFVINGKREKKFEEVKTFNRSTYEWKNEQWLPNENLRAEEILSLSYDNFKRTIIIPQGQFKEFLELGDKDRTTMLKEIFNLYKYEFYNETVTIEKEAIASNNQIIGKLEQLEQFTNEGFNEENEALQNLKKQITAETLELSDVDKKWQIINKIKDDSVNYNILKTENSQLETKKGSIEILKTELHDYELCYDNFKHLLATESSVKHEKNELEIELETISLVITEKSENLKSITNSNNTLLSNFKTIEILNQTLNDWRYINQIQQTELENKNDKTEISQSLKQVEELKAKKSQVEKTLIDYELQLKELKTKQINAPLLADLDVWFAQQNSLNDNLKKEETRIALVEENFSKASNHKVELIDNKQISRELKSKLHQTKLSACQNIINNEIKLKEEKNKRLDKQRTILIEQQSLVTHSHNLIDGKPCPLCGSNSHPMPIIGEKTSIEFDNVHSQITLTNQEIDNLKLLKEELKSLLSKSKEIFMELKLLKKENKETNNLAVLHIEKKPKLDLNYNELTKAKEQLKLEEVKRNKLELSISNSRKTTTELQKKIDVTITQSQHLKEKADSVKGKIDSYKEQLKLLNFDEVKPQNAKKEILELENTLIQIQQNELRLAEIEKEITVHQVTLKTKLEQFKKLETLYQKTMININENIAISAFENIKIIDDILKKELDINKTRTVINDFQIAYKLNKSKLKEIEKRLNGKTFSEEQFELLSQQKEKVGLRLKELDQLFGVSISNLENIKKQLVQKTELEKEQNTLAARLEDIKSLKSLFRQSGFVSYVSTIYLRELCNAANLRFMPLTHNQLSIEINEANQFVVRDHLNGGKTRLAKTLSGGQKFQASLSLALALSERVSKRQYQPKHFFFIDEGFGALDQESLQQVYETLQNLTKENKIIGVISHMEALQENITNYLYIENHPNHGSMIAMNV